MVEGAAKEPDGQQSIEEAMEYLQKVEKELPDVEFAEFLSIIEDLLALVATVLAFLLPVLLFLAAVGVSVWGLRTWLRRRNQSFDAP